ncbi:MAG: DUF2877 domain-containing protein [Actinobacteria bacterium]|uniref:Unannotated protein n=1 Tax=freshwater metagenome TaxID=449393 RepID=A0A6J7EEM3_9ZZZZ|nr:DUF2877 domain-containing protein [Actinomycetota bacterium]
MSRREPPDIGRAVVEALSSDCSGEVIAVFSRASYVEVGDRVFAIVSTAEFSGPLHARVPEPPTLRVGTRASVTGGRLLLGDQAFELPSERWNPAPFSAAVSVPVMLDRVLVHEPALDLGSRPRADLGSALGSSLGEALRRGGLAAACEGLFGRGSGLTPAGDDVAAGLMIAESLTGLGDEGTRLGIAATAPTHLISRAFLASAARGQSLEPLHRLLAACAADDLAAARRARADLAAVGHTSGLDLAYGALVGLRWAAEATSEVRPARRITSRALAQTTA